MAASDLAAVLTATCRTLIYDAQQRQFAITLKNNIDSIFLTLKKERHISLDDFNDIVDSITHPLRRCREIPVGELREGDILPSEVMLCDVGTHTITLVKMTQAQYLLTHTGARLALSTTTIFRQGTTITTAEGHDYGTIQHLYLLAPTRAHIILSNILIPQYYRHPISDNLWTIRNTADDLARATWNTSAQQLLTLAQQHGVSLFALLHIINTPQ